LWAGELGLSNNGIYYDTVMMTFQVSGDGANLVSGLMTIAMAIAVSITAWLAYRAAKAGVHYATIMPLAVLTATLDLIVFNKVGSPQFVTWLAVPIILGLLYRAASWRLPMFAAVAIAALSNLVYPIFYDELLSGDVGALALLTLRNAVYVALLVWANIKLSALAKR
jgi:ABC-type amino acid transport system permease subunit